MNRITKSELSRFLDIINQRLEESGHGNKCLTFDNQAGRLRVAQNGRYISDRFLTNSECREWLYGFDTCLDIVYGIKI